MGAPTRFDRDGKCPNCKRGVLVNDKIVRWEKGRRRDGSEVNLPRHDCQNPTGLAPNYEFPPGALPPVPSSRGPGLPIAAAAVSGPGTTEASTPGSPSPSAISPKTKYVQIAAWVPINEAPHLLARIAEIHEREKD